MIRSFEYYQGGPFGECTNSSEGGSNNNHGALGAFSQPEKIEPEAAPQILRSSLSPKKTQKTACVQHFIPSGNNNKSTPIKIKLSPKMEKVTSSSRKLASPMRSPRPLYPVPTSGRRESIKNQFFAVDGLPAPPLVADAKAADPKAFVRTNDGDSSVATWMNDNPVLQKRSSRAAIVIQAAVRRMLAAQVIQVHKQTMAALQIQRLVRGYVQRVTWSRVYAETQAAIAVQRMARGFLVRTHVVRYLGAIHIQRMARGHLGRLRAKVARLERTLATVQAEHAADLEHIRQRTARQMSKKSIFAEQKKSEKKQRLATETIDELRRSNRLLREKNKSLEESCEEIKKQNKLLENITKKTYENIDILKTNISKWEADQRKLLVVVREFQQKRDKLLEEIDRAKEQTEFEQKVAAIYVKTIKENILKINETCPDKSLANNIHSDVRAAFEKVQAKITASA